MLNPGLTTLMRLQMKATLRRSFRGARSAVFTSSIFSVVLLRYTHVWFAGWIGIYLALMFIQLLSTSVVLIGQSIGERSYTRPRKLVAGLLIIVLLIAVFPILRARYT